jgi:hypothetical protein
MGGLGESKIKHQWYCPKLAIARFRMECEHGHRGQVMPLCGDHYKEYSGGKVQFCPRCNQEPPGHKCKLEMREVS